MANSLLLNIQKKVIKAQINNKGGDLIFSYSLDITTESKKLTDNLPIYCSHISNILNLINEEKITINNYILVLHDLVINTQAGETDAVGDYVEHVKQDILSKISIANSPLNLLIYDDVNNILKYTYSYCNSKIYNKIVQEFSNIGINNFTLFSNSSFLKQYSLVSDTIIFNFLDNSIECFNNVKESISNECGYVSILNNIMSAYEINSPTKLDELLKNWLHAKSINYNEPIFFLHNYLKAFSIKSLNVTTIESNFQTLVSASIDAIKKTFPIKWDKKIFLYSGDKTFNSVVNSIDDLNIINEKSDLIDKNIFYICQNDRFSNILTKRIKSTNKWALKEVGI